MESGYVVYEHVLGPIPHIHIYKIYDFISFIKKYTRITAHLRSNPLILNDLLPALNCLIESLQKIMYLY